MAAQEHKRKLELHTLEMKYQVLKALENGKKRNDVCHQFNIKHNTLSGWIAKAAKIKKQYEDGCINSTAKKIKQAKNPGLEMAVYTWYIDAIKNDPHLHVSRDKFTEKAEQFAFEMGITNFIPSNGWFSRFKQRYNMTPKSKKIKREIEGENSDIHKSSSTTGDLTLGVSTSTDNSDSKHFQYNSSLVPLPNTLNIGSSSATDITDCKHSEQNSIVISLPNTSGTGLSATTDSYISELPQHSSTLVLLPENLNNGISTTTECSDSKQPQCSSALVPLPTSNTGLSTTDSSNSKHPQRSSTLVLLPGTNIGLSTTDSSKSHDKSTLVTLPDTSSINMSVEHGIQIRHLQEQISYQKKTVEKLEKLVTFLNSERNFYKDQISELKGEIERLTDRMNSPSSAATSERQVSAMKRELMREIENVKTMLQNFAQETINAKTSSLSSPWKDDIWTMKEDLTEGLEQVHKELSFMNKRIDRLESEAVTKPCDTPRPVALSKNVHRRSQYLSSPVLCTPPYRGSDEINSLDVHQLRQSVDSLNSKLDNLGRKIDIVQPKQQKDCTGCSGCSKRSCNLTSRKYSAINMNDDSVSELSDITSLSENDTDDSIEEPSFELRGASTSERRTSKNSTVYKTGKSKPGKTKLRLHNSYLDKVYLDTDSLD